jgi:hypothetical protein
LTKIDTYSLLDIEIPEGCSEGESSIQATDEQKKTFRELVDLVTYVGQQYAITVQ